MEPVYLHDWKDGCLTEVASDFETDPDQMEGVEILLASYSYEHYEGDAFVLFSSFVRSPCRCRKLLIYQWFGECVGCILGSMCRGCVKNPPTTFSPLMPLQT